MLKNAFSYKEWSDRRLLSALADIKAECSQEVIQFAKQQLNHMVIVEELFRARLEGIPTLHKSTNTPELPELSVLEHRLMTSNAWFKRCIYEISPDKLQESIQFEFVDGLSGNMSIMEILFHIVNHGTYHRSAIGHYMQHAGYIRPADTYSLYIHQAEPSRRKNIKNQYKNMELGGQG